MKYVMCSVLDAVADQYGRPFCALSDAAAVRSFTSEVNRPDESSMLWNNPSDFSLFAVGYFDDADASIDLICPPRQLCAGRAVAKRPDAISEANRAGTISSLKEVKHG